MQLEKGQKERVRHNMNNGRRCDNGESKNEGSDARCKDTTEARDWIITAVGNTSTLVGK